MARCSARVELGGGRLGSRGTRLLVPHGLREGVLNLGAELDHEGAALVGRDAELGPDGGQLLRRRSGEGFEVHAKPKARSANGRVVLDVARLLTLLERDYLGT